MNSVLSYTNKRESTYGEYFILRKKYRILDAAKNSNMSWSIFADLLRKSRASGKQRT